MRSVLRFVTTRYGVAGLLALVILVVVGVARLFGTEGGSGPVLPAAPPSLETPVSAEPDDGEPDEGTEGFTLPSDAPDPLPTATAFATAWVNANVSAEEWLAGLEPYATEELIAQLSGVDPVSVPASRLTGPAELSGAGTGEAPIDADGSDENASAAPTYLGWAEAIIPLDNGILRLGLVLQTDAVWLVDSIDWERS